MSKAGQRKQTMYYLGRYDAINGNDNSYRWRNHLLKSVYHAGQREGNWLGNKLKKHRS